MTKTDQVTTMTQLENEINDKLATNPTVNIVDNDYHQQKCEIVQEDLQNNNEIKCGVLHDIKYEQLKAATESNEEAAVSDEEAPIQLKKTHLFGFEFDAPLKWDNISGIIIIHVLFIYAILCREPLPKCWQTYLWGFILGGLSGFGVTGGAHRFWTHRAYKATTPLRIILMLCFTLAGQNSIYEWVRDHRVHHKFSETDADPHNSNRGFFFAHVGWLMMHKHPEVVRKGRLLDLSDIMEDPVVRFHQKFFIPMKLLLCFIMPVLIPIYWWGEGFYWSFFSQVVIRYTLSLNFTWLVNSAAHLWGTRPYDKKINPVENISVSIVAMGEGWHNYHHAFPWDYKAAELAHRFNITTFWIQAFAKIGWAYDLKEPSAELVRKTIEKCGDGTHPVFGHHMSEVPPPDDMDTKKSS